MCDLGKSVTLLISSDHLAERNSWPDMIRRAKSLGFLGIELFGADLVGGPLANTSSVRELRGLAEELDLILTAHPWFDWTEFPEAKAIQEGIKLLHRCADL